MVLKKNVVTFEFFRFQILPISRAGIQLDIEESISSYEQLVARKNDFFSFVLNDKIKIRHSKSSVTIKLVKRQDDCFIFLMNVKRKIKRSTEDFRQEEIEDFPRVYIVINNNSKIQAIAIERNHRAFESTNTIAFLLQAAFVKYLRRYYLSIYIEPIYSKDDFWEIVNLYKDSITQIDFELIRPNMSNISNTIDAQLKDLERETDAHKLKMTLQSNRDSALIIEEGNSQISGIVDYASEGGGAIRLKIKGLNRKVSTNKTTQELSVEEMELENASSEDLKNLFQAVFKDG